MRVEVLESWPKTNSDSEGTPVQPVGIQRVGVTGERAQMEVASCSLLALTPEPDIDGSFLGARGSRLCLRFVGGGGDVLSVPLGNEYFRPYAEQVYKILGFTHPELLAVCEATSQSA